MSMRSKVNFKCPKCNANVEAEQWSAVNGAKNPQQKVKILDGSLFTAKCKACGNVSRIGFPMLYNDTEKNYMIWLVYEESEINHVSEYFKSSKNDLVEDENGEAVDVGCRQRIVLSPDQLREKIMIFDSGLDDKIIEIMKLHYAKQVQLSIKDGDEVAAVFFSNNNGDKKIEIFTKKGKSWNASASMSIYKKIEDEYGGKASYAEDRVFVIDDDWAAALVISMKG